jgi:hypothetical protein
MELQRTAPKKLQMIIMLGTNDAIKEVVEVMNNETHTDFKTDLEFLS